MKSISIFSTFGKGGAKHWLVLPFLKVGWSPKHLRKVQCLAPPFLKVDLAQPFLKVEKVEKDIKTTPHITYNTPNENTTLFIHTIIFRKKFPNNQKCEYSILQELHLLQTVAVLK